MLWTHFHLYLKILRFDTLVCHGVVVWECVCVFVMYPCFAHCLEIQLMVQKIERGVITSFHHTPLVSWSHTHRHTQTCSLISACFSLIMFVCSALTHSLRSVIPPSCRTDFLEAIKVFDEHQARLCPND